MELTIKDNKIILVLGTHTYEVKSWVEVQQILEKHLEKKGDR